MAMSFSHPDPASPAAVADASFKTTRRGFDQGEVHEFLRMVAAELGRLQERERFLERELRTAQTNPDLNAVDLDDAALTRLLGEETARVLTTARESANAIRDKAEQSGAQLLMEASDEAARVREEADIEAARRRADATADAESEIEMAKQQGREMVNEARAYRERVLSELARRRELAREQIEQLVHGRDRLTQAFERARLVAADVVAELEPLGEPSEYVNLAPTTGPVPVMVANESPPSESEAAASETSEPETRESEAGEPVASESEAGVPELDGPDPAGTNSVGDDAAIDDAAIDGLEIVEEDDGDGRGDGTGDDTATHAETDPGGDTSADDSTGADAVDDPADDADGEIAQVIELIADGAAAERVDDGATSDAIATETEVAAAGDPEAETADDAAAGASERDAGESDDEAIGETGDEATDESDDEAHDESDGGSGDEVVVDLFARLRAETEDSARSTRSTRSTGSDAAGSDAAASDAAASTAAGESATLVGDLVEASEEPAEAAADFPADGRETPFGRRDAELTPIIVACGKKLKRVLADEQNEVLEALRRGDAVTDIDAVLPAGDEHLARYRDAIAEELLDAANAGAQAITGGAVGKLRKKQASVAGDASGDVIEEWLVVPLRERLDRCVAEGDGDNAVVSRRARSVYREWKTQHIDEQLDDVVRMAYGRGAFEAVASGKPLVWSIDGDHAACPDCDDNGLAGPVAAGEEYPTGHRFAAAHPGCRCLLLPPGR